MRITAGLFMAYITAVREPIQAEASAGRLGLTLPGKLFAISAAAPLRGESEISSWARGLESLRSASADIVWPPIAFPGKLPGPVAVA